MKKVSCWKKFIGTGIFLLTISGIAFAEIPTHKTDQPEMMASIFLGEKFLINHPFGVDGNQNEFGVSLEMKQPKWYNWSLAASISRATSFGNVTSIVSEQNCVTIQYDDDPVTNCTSIENIITTHSFLDETVFDIGIKRHWHLKNVNVRKTDTTAYLSGGLNFMSAELDRGGSSDTGTTLGAFLGVGLQMDFRPVVLGLNYKFSYDPVTVFDQRYDFGGNEFTFSVGVRF